MNMLIWNCRGVLNPTFCDVVNDLIQMHSPTIMVVGETKVCGEKANRILGRINLDRAIFANSIGLSGGLWILWDSNQVEILEVASIEQEIHVIVNSSSRPPLAPLNNLCQSWLCRKMATVGESRICGKPLLNAMGYSR